MISNKFHNKVWLWIFHCNAYYIFNLVRPIRLQTKPHTLLCPVTVNKPTLLPAEVEFSLWIQHWNNVIMCTRRSQITSITIVYSTVYSDADQIKHPSSASMAFVRGIHRTPVNSTHKWPVTRKMLSFDDVILSIMGCNQLHDNYHGWIQIMTIRKWNDVSKAVLNKYLLWFSIAQIFNKPPFTQSQ